MSCGTLARIDGVVPSGSREVDWQQGCAIVEYEPIAHGLFTLHPVPIWSGVAIYGGLRYNGSEDTAALKAHFRAMSLA